MDVSKGDPMNAGEFRRRNARTIVASIINIARKARSKAEADFATWLMMAKLGSFDELPSNAQKFLIDYRARLETMSEAESTALAIREVYSAYYNELGGVGTAPELQARKANTERKTARSSRSPKPQSTAAAHNPSGPIMRKSLRALLIFGSMVALIVTYNLLMH